jgi:hypothetical protein
MSFGSNFTPQSLDWLFKSELFKLGRQTQPLESLSGPDLEGPDAGRRCKDSCCTIV